MTLAFAAPAWAGEVWVVDGDHATRVNDPVVPTRAQATLPAIPRAPRGGAIAGAARSGATTARRGDPRVRTAGVRPAKAILAVVKVLDGLKAKGQIDDAAYAGYKRTYSRARTALRKLRGARRTQLAYVIGSVERLAVTGKLIPTRLPASFLQLQRNTQFWPKMPYPAVGDQVSFRGSQILFQYYANSGLQIQPLSTFKKANLIHGACIRQEPECDPEAIRTLLDEMTGLAVQRSKRFIAWEYLFYFGGGSPPWISGMAEATAIQAYARASQLLADPAYIEVAKRALPVFDIKPPVGVRVRGFRGGVHYLQYSFAPGTFIFNAFLQSLIGLYDFHTITGDTRALRMYQQAEPEAEHEIPFSDLGDWSMYSYRGEVSDSSYHELLREFLASMCSRKLGDEYCVYAKKYAGYQTDPPVLTFKGPDVAATGVATRINFNVSKLSAVELKVYKGNKLAYSTLGTFSLGNRYFTWTPKSPGVYRIDVAAKELRTGLGKKDRDSGEIAVE